MDLAEIPTLLHGHLASRIEDDTLVVERLTPRQLAHFAEHAMWGIRAVCTAGISLAFETEAEEVELALVLGRHCRDWSAVDIEVDGVLQPTLRSAGPPRTWSHRFLFGPGSHRVRIALPLTCEAAIRSLQADAELRPLRRRRRTLLTIGDSITQGMTGSGMMSSMAWRMADLLGAELVCQGVGGHVFDAGSFDPELPLEPDLVTVAYGTNDWATGTAHEAIVHNARAHLAAISQRWLDVPIACIAPLWREIPKLADLRDFNACCREVLGLASELDGVLPVDGRKLVAQRADRFVDGVHPNDCGFAEYATALHGVLRKAGVV